MNNPLNHTVRANRFRTTDPAPRPVPPAKIHATPRVAPRYVKISFWQRLKRQIIRKRELIATELALAGVLYMMGRFVVGFVSNKRLAEMATLGTIAAILMLASALLISLDSEKDNHRIQ